MKKRRDSEPICPYCGHLDRDWAFETRSPFDLEDRGAVVECGECEQEYYLTCSVAITYITETIE